MKIPISLHFAHHFCLSILQRGFLPCPGNPVYKNENKIEISNQLGKYDLNKLKSLFLHLQI